MQAPLIVLVAVTMLAPGAPIGAHALLPKDGVCPASHPIKAIVTPRATECVYQEDCGQAKEVLSSR
ncbi:MAG: hypothetical protein HYU41_26495 [Candidatus Rokubacteria bacterium]|nr:hypothetical protein [Candidatus Rokubacteria bacterium]